MPNESPSDHSLLRRFRRGQNDAPTLLYLRYAERIRMLATRQIAHDLNPRFDAEDIVQSVFHTFFRRAAEGEYDVPAGEGLWKLLLVISLNKLRAVADHHRAARRDVRHTVNSARYDQAISTEFGRDEAALNILHMVIDELLDSLPSSHRPIIEMRIEGYEVTEIARTLQRSKRTVERVLQAFRQKLDAQIREGD